jgi:hypothetical protein
VVNPTKINDDCFARHDRHEGSLSDRVLKDEPCIDRADRAFRLLDFCLRLVNSAQRSPEVSS